MRLRVGGASQRIVGIHARENQRIPAILELRSTMELPDNQQEPRSGTATALAEAKAPDIRSWRGPLAHGPAKPERVLITIALVSTLGALLFGFDTGVISGA